MVSRAVAGDDLESVAASASEALGLPVAIALPALGPPVVSPAQAASGPALDALAGHARATIQGEPVAAAEGSADSVPIRLGPEVVGAVTALGTRRLAAEQRAWLEAAAAAATVALLMRDAQGEELKASRDGLVAALCRGPVAGDELAPLLAQIRRLGYELGAGAVALCALVPDHAVDQLPADALLASAGDGRLVGLVPLHGAGDADGAADALRARGCEVAVAAARREPAKLHEAVREASVLLDLALGGEPLFSGEEDIYRLLIGILLRDRIELEQLRDRTIALVGAYDAEHDTELLATLQAFLAHHGSTTETAEAMRLHRHTVGYRLTRVQEVSGLSPYESDGRERLSLGLKAQQILEADNRRVWRD